jgi:hypothetical protein
MFWQSTIKLNLPPAGEPTELSTQLPLDKAYSEMADAYKLVFWCM